MNVLPILLRFELMIKMRPSSQYPNIAYLLSIKLVA